MAHCININHPEYKKLVPQFKGPEALLKAKISIWQENNGLDNFPTIDQLEERKNILYDKMSIEEKIQKELTIEQNKKVSENVLKVVADKLTKRTNIPYKIINFSEVTDKTIKSDDKGYYDPNDKIIYFIRENFTLETVFHEFAHPIVDRILYRNNKLYNELKNELTSDVYIDILKEIIKTYTLEDYKFDTTVTQEELNNYNDNELFKFFEALPKDVRIGLLSEGITNVWGQESEKWIDKKTGKVNLKLAEDSSLVRLWKTIVEWFKDFIRSGNVEDITPNTSFRKLGKLLAIDDSKFNLTDINQNEVTITPAHRNTILLQKNDTNAKFDNEIKKIYDKLEMYSYDEYIPAIKYSNAVHLIQQYNRDNNNSNYELAMKRYYNRTSKIVVQPKSLIESKENNLLTKDEGNIRMTINDLFKKVDKDVKHEMEIALKIRTIEIKKVSEVPNEYSIMKVADLHHKELIKQYGALEGTIKYFEEITALNKRFNIKEFLNEEELKPFEEKLNDYNANNPGNSHFYQKINLPTNDKRDKYIFKINFTKVENIADQQNTIISNIEEDNSISLDNKQEEKTDEEIKQELLAKKDFEKKAENIKENIIQYGNVQGKEFSQQKIIFPEDINLTDTQKSMLMNFDTHFPNYSFLTLLEKTLLIEALGDGDITMYCNI